jgi:hypothetical protein
MVIDLNNKNQDISNQNSNHHSTTNGYHSNNPPSSPSKSKDNNINQNVNKDKVEVAFQSSNSSQEKEVTVNNITPSPIWSLPETTTTTPPITTPSVPKPTVPIPDGKAGEILAMLLGTNSNSTDKQNPITIPTSTSSLPTSLLYSNQTSSKTSVGGLNKLSNVLGLPTATSSTISTLSNISVPTTTTNTTSTDVESSGKSFYVSKSGFKVRL